MYLFIGPVRRATHELLWLSDYGIRFLAPGDRIGSLSPIVAYVLFCFTIFVSNFGLNVTTYILPIQVFTVSVRSTFHGFCSACGKIGAVVSTLAYPMMLWAALMWS